MHKLRLNNATFFVTVMSACLGLLIGGVPLEAHARQGSANAADKSQSATNATEPESPAQAQKLAATYNSAFSMGGCREHGEPAEVFYTNTRALADNDQVLIVTRLPRAGLGRPAGGQTGGKLS
jgi:hypothetical protein